MSLLLKRHAIRIAVACAVVAISWLGALAARAGEPNSVYLPLLAGGNGQPAPNPPAGATLPSDLVGSWFSGQVLNIQLYNRDTGIWSDPGGLGHMYGFNADGSYVLASYLKLGEGTLCVSTVWKYHTGAARVEGDRLILTPNYARTRTQIVCGSRSDTETEGPLETTSLPWQLGVDEQGHTRLKLVEAQGETLYYKDGLAPQMLGAWRDGDQSGAGFYDPATGQWGEPTAEGEWYAFGGDGRYRRGNVRVVSDDGVCQNVALRYEEGTLKGSGSNIMLLSTLSVQRTINLCDASDVVETSLPAGVYERWTWALKQGAEGEVLDLLRIEGGFQQRSLVRDE